MTLVPTLRVGMPSSTLRVVRARPGDGRRASRTAFPRGTVGTSDRTLRVPVLSSVLLFPLRFSLFPPLDTLPDFTPTGRSGRLDEPFAERLTDLGGPVAVLDHEAGDGELL